MRAATLSGERGSMAYFHVPQKNSSFIYVTNNGFYKVHVMRSHEN